MSKAFLTPTSWIQHEIQIELIGAGGTGSCMMDELFRLHALLTRLDHPGLRVRVWDGDTVSEANVGRQRFWPCDVGWNKAELLCQRYNSFGGTDWEYESRFIQAADCRRIRPDLLISCVDDPRVRVMLAKAGRKQSDPDALWIDTGNDANSGQVILGHWSGWTPKANKLPNVFDLYPSLKGQESHLEPSCSTEEAVTRQAFGINQRIAAEASGLMWQLLRHGGLNRHGSYVHQDDGEVTPLAISTESWSTFGLEVTQAQAA